MSLRQEAVPAHLLGYPEEVGDALEDGRVVDDVERLRADVKAVVDPRLLLSRGGGEGARLVQQVEQRLLRRGRLPRRASHGPERRSVNVLVCLIKNCFFAQHISNLSS